MSNELWRDKLREHFADYEQPEPSGLWEDVEREMIARRQVAPRPLSGRILRWGSRVAAIAAMIVAVLWLGRIAFREDAPQTNTTPADVIAENRPQSDIPADKPMVGEGIAEPFPTDKPVFVARGERFSKPILGAIASETVAEYVATEQEPVISDDSTHEPSPAAHPEEKPEPAKPNSAQERQPAANNFGNGDLFAMNEPVKSRRSTWSARIVASGISGSGAQSQHRGYGALSTAIPQMDYSADAVLGRGAMSDIMILNKDTRTYTEARHNPPIRAGLKLSYGLTDRLSVESGLNYTYLGSKLKSGSEQRYYETRQSLHYVGIPVGLSYSLWQNHRLRVYVSGGGMMEKNISGSVSTEYTDGELTFARESERLRVKELQWSVNASAGVQMDISPRVGVFADPGVSYHFDNGSAVETVYKKNPLNFDLTFGLRFSLD
jgi:hypothetical protein